MRTTIPVSVLQTSDWNEAMGTCSIIIYMMVHTEIDRLPAVRGSHLRWLMCVRSRAMQKA